MKICLLQQPGEAAGRKAELPILGSGHNYSEAQWGWGWEVVGDLERSGRDLRREKSTWKAKKSIWKTDSKHRSNGFTLRSRAPSLVREQPISRLFVWGEKGLKQKQQNR